MKRISVAIILLLLSSSLFAESWRTNIAINTIGQGETSLGVDFKGGARLSLGGSFGMNWDSGWGFDVFAAYAGRAFMLRPSATYSLPLNPKKTITMMFLLGPKLIVGGGATLWGLDVMSHFDFHIGRNMFIRLGTGLQMTFAKDDFQGYIPIPDVAIGWHL